MLKSYIKQLIQGNDLTFEQSFQAGNILFENDIPVQTAAFLTLLAAKGETVDEFAGLIQAVKQHTLAIKFDYPVLDIVGTGGDHSNSINISTASALLTAACGVPVVKHGNRAVSSSCGSADVLEALGYRLNQTPDEIINNVAKTNFGFCFAQKFHPIFAKLREIRKNLGVPTILNLFGPLSNPANAQHLVLGVYDPKRVELVAKTLLKIGTKRSLVFSGYGLDELSCLGKIDALLVTENEIKPFTIDPLELGLRKSSLEDLSGGDALYNSQIISEVLSGKDMPLSDTLILNAAAALFIYGSAATLSDCVDIARSRLSIGNIVPRNRLHEIILRKRKPIIKRKSLKAALLSKPGGAVISEIKRASPSAGKIAAIDDPVARAKEYVAAGAAAVSVLTDEGFEGTMADLTVVSNALKDTPVAILCKDFFLSPEQIAEAASAGADAILIMVSVLHNNTANMVRIAHDFGLETLVEVHHPDELPIALASGGDVIGINQRDLRDFSMHPEIFSQMISKIPSNMVKVAESGIETKADKLAMYKLGYDAVLVGSALSRLQDPKEFFI